MTTGTGAGGGAVTTGTGAGGGAVTTGTGAGGRADTLGMALPTRGPRRGVHDQPGQDIPEPRPATAPPEVRGLRRDDVAMLVSVDGRHHHARFLDLPDFLRPGDLLVVNDSATLAARVPLRVRAGEATLHLSTRFGHDLWLAEPRWSVERPGPLPLRPGEHLSVAGLEARALAPYPHQPRLWFVQVDGVEAMARAGRPIRYAHVPGDHPLRFYRTVFARVPGSAEMPSAGRPFSVRALARLRAAGILTASVTLHTGVSSLEHDDGPLRYDTQPPEPYHVPRFTARAVAHTRAQGGRVIAVGTSVVRALESAVSGGRVRPGGGFTRRVLHPSRRPVVVDGLLTGFHEPRSTHLALLSALAGEVLVADAYRAAASGPYLWHEFGDVHLLVAPPELRQDSR